MSRNQRGIRSTGYRGRISGGDIDRMGWEELKGLKYLLPSLIICFRYGYLACDSCTSRKAACLLSPPPPISVVFWSLVHCAMEMIGRELCKAKCEMGNVTCLAFRKKYFPGTASVVFHFNQSLHLWGKTNGMRDKISSAERKGKISNNVRN